MGKNVPSRSGTEGTVSTASAEGASSTTAHTNAIVKQNSARVSQKVASFYFNKQFDKRVLLNVDNSKKMTGFGCGTELVEGEHA
jgi:hypothetical protein